MLNNIILGITIIFCLYSIFTNKSGQRDSLLYIILFSCLCLFVYQLTHSSAETKKQEDPIPLFVDENIDLKTTVNLDNISFSYKNLLPGQDARSPKARFFLNDGLKFQLLKDGYPVRFNSVTKDSENKVLLCKHADGDLEIGIKDENYNTCYKFKLKLNEEKNAKYSICANGEPNGNLYILPKDAKSPIQMSGNVCQNAHWTALQIDYCIMYVRGFRNSHYSSSGGIFAPKIYHSSEEIKEEAKFIVDRVPLIFSNIDSGAYNIPKADYFVNIQNNLSWKSPWSIFSTLRTFILKVIEKIMDIFNSPLLCLFVVGFLYKILTLFDFKSHLSKPDSFNFAGFFKVSIALCVAGSFSNSGILCIKGILWMSSSPLDYRQDHILPAICTLVDNLFIKIYQIALNTGVQERVVVSIATSLLIPLTLIILYETIMQFKGRRQRFLGIFNYRFYLNFHFKILIIFCNLLLIALTYKGIAILFAMPTMFIKVYNLALWVPFYCSPTIYSYFLSAKSVDNSDSLIEDPAMIILKIAMPIIMFVLWNLIMPIMGSFASPIWMLGFSANSFFDMIEGYIVRRFYTPPPHSNKFT